MEEIIERPQSIVGILEGNPNLDAGEAHVLQADQINRYRKGLAETLGISIEEIHAKGSDEVRRMLAEQEGRAA